MRSIFINFSARVSRRILNAMPLRKPLGQSVDWQQRQALYRNFSKLYALGFFFGLHLVVPIFVPLLQGHGLSMSQIMQTQAIFSLTVAALELPSGYMADLWGRKQALIIGSLVSTCGFLVLQQATSFMDFIIFLHDRLFLAHSPMIPLWYEWKKPLHPPNFFPLEGVLFSTHFAKFILVEKSQFK